MRNVGFDVTYEVETEEGNIVSGSNDNTLKISSYQGAGVGTKMINPRQGKLLNWSTCDKMNEAF